jgi:hypothetical protein
MSNLRECAWIGCYSKDLPHRDSRYCINHSKRHEWISDTDQQAPIGRPILRPHVIYGVMSVISRPDLRLQPNHHWFSVGMTTSWPDDAFEPCWMDLPVFPDHLKTYEPPKLKRLEMVK